MLPTFSRIAFYIRTPVTRTVKGNEKQFELEGNASYRGKFQGHFDQGKGSLVRFSGELKLSEFELSRFYCRRLIKARNLVIEIWAS